MEFLDETLIRWIHLLAAATWVGGMIFLLFIALPTLSLRRETARAPTFTHTFARFLKIVWISVGLLILTGIGNLYIRLQMQTHTPLTVYYYGVFFLKFILFIGMLSMAGKLHFAIIPKLRELEAGSSEEGQKPVEELGQWQKKALRLTQGNLLIGVIIFLLAAYLTALATGHVVSE